MYQMLNSLIKIKSLSISRCPNMVMKEAEEDDILDDDDDKVIEVCVVSIQ